YELPNDNLLVMTLESRKLSGNLVTGRRFVLPRLTATTMKKPATKYQRIPSRSKWPLLAWLLLGAGLLAAATAWFIWQQYRLSHPPATEVAIIEPPAIELSGIDPAVSRAIEKARAAVNESPRSAQTWGQLGKTLLAHGIHHPAGTCLAQAERLEPAEPRWPYLQGIALVSADPPDPGAAIQHFQSAVDRGGNTPNVLRLYLGEILLAQDRL